MLNRQVTKQEDIAAVSEEYARYKEVKVVLNERGKWDDREWM